MSGDGIFRWFYAGGEEPEIWYGRLGTREEAVDAGWANCPDGDFSIVEADSARVSFDIFDASRVIDDYEERNIECWSEDGAQIEIGQHGRELELALAETLKTWMDKHGLRGRVWSFGETRNQEYFPLKEVIRPSREPGKIAINGE